MRHVLIDGGVPAFLQVTRSGNIFGGDGGPDDFQSIDVTLAVIFDEPGLVNIEMGDGESIQQIERDQWTTHRYDKPGEYRVVASQESTGAKPFGNDHQGRATSMLRAPHASAAASGPALRRRRPRVRQDWASGPTIDPSSSTATPWAERSGGLKSKFAVGPVAVAAGASAGIRLERFVGGEISLPKDPGLSDRYNFAGTMFTHFQSMDSTRTPLINDLLEGLGGKAVLPEPDTEQVGTGFEISAGVKAGFSLNDQSSGAASRMTPASSAGRQGKG